MEFTKIVHDKIQNAANHANLDRVLNIDENLNYNTLHVIIQQAKLKTHAYKNGSIW